MNHTQLALTAVALAGSLQLAQAQTSARQSPPNDAGMQVQVGPKLLVMMDDKMGGSPPAGTPMADDKMGGKPPGGMPMMDDRMGAKPPGGMPMVDDKMGGMPAPVMPGAGGAQAPMERMMSMMGMAMSNMPAMAGRVGMMMPPYEHAEGRIAFLQAELSITDAQMPQWHAFADAMRSAAKSMRAAVAAQAASTSVSAPARSEREIQFLSARLDAMRTVHAAGTALYAVLSDDQKRIADDQAAGSMGHM